MINNTSEEYSICLTEMRKDPRYIKNYILLANFFFMAFLPFIILIITNSLIYKTITNISKVNRKSTSRQKRDQSIAMILVGIVIVFGVCNTFRIIINLYEVSFFLICLKIFFSQLTIPILIKNRIELH